MKITVEELEAYLHDHYSGRANEQSMFMKLVEEVGEAAELLNKRAGRKAAGGEDLQAALAAELADIIHYTVAIAAINDIDINSAIIEKDKKAAVKYRHETDLESFVSKRRLEEKG